MCFFISFSKKYVYLFAAGADTLTNYNIMSVLNSNPSESDQNKLFSHVVRAGKRTYFFDVKDTKNNDRYITITESRRRYDEETHSSYFEKHKLFLYKEDFEKFSEAFQAVIDFVQSMPTEKMVCEEVFSLSDENDPDAS